MNTKRNDKEGDTTNRTTPLQNHHSSYDEKQMSLKKIESKENVGYASQT